MADDQTPEPAPRRDRCETCRFWKKNESQIDSDLHPDDEEGRCRRLPPQFLSSVLTICVRDRELDHDQNSEYRFDAESEAFNTLSGMVVWSQPVTTGGDWCGEWQLKREGT